MNAKKAKMLRHAAEYRNQSATPGVMDFPGIARMIKVPMFDTHPAVKTSYIKLPMDDHFTKVHTEVQRLTHGKDGKPIMLMELPTAPLYKLEPKYQIVALSKPGKLRTTEPKGLYRQLKKLASKHGMFKPGQAKVLARLMAEEMEVA